ncbi:hypothetical protein K458DRAFT_457743 [Lentithecium fluviatile CBS 122367]|uniref:UbiA prenyltransferase n=1 Tax=Lentithecium fluviatile CBS 122367 TaxID=1168545 RepID=A0A6G1IT53_9PLEO|nr:hypothetical protein K458DRAFT_457743 [Lentithecium fluviatile CBS 122367]
MKTATEHQGRSIAKALYGNLRFHSKTVYLFICNYNVIIIVWAGMGTISSKRSTHHTAVLHFSNSQNTSHWADTLKSFSLSMIWVIIVALGFSISNQRQPASIQEDSLNKPWRPLPSRRITSSQASAILLITTIIGLLYSVFLGGLVPYLIQLVASYYYNDLGGAQGHHVIRDALNAIGMTSWLFGCIKVAGGPGFQFSNSELFTSVALVAAIVTTIAIQDFRDLDGDRECGRATLPIVLGHGAARVLLATSVLLWSLGIVMVKSLGIVSGPTGLGTLIAARLLLFRNRSADKITMELWYGWFATLALAVL